MVAYPRSFVGQFVISPRDEVPAIADGVVHELNGLAVATIGDLPITRVYDANDRLIGALLGHPVDYRQGRMIRDVLKLDARHPGDDGLEDFIEAWVYRYGGPYIFVLDDGEARRVYLDAGGSMSAVFDEAKPLCAATAGLLLSEEDYSRRFRAELYDYLHILDDGWFPAGMTAHLGIGRILCNHYLDFSDGRQHRHWPRTPTPLARDPDEACATINAVVAATMKTLQAAGPVVTTLTAGNETRLILAACRDLKDSMQFVTIKGEDENRLDAERAAELARTFGLKHQLLSIRYGDEEGIEQWRARCGHCIGGANMRSYPSVEPLASYAFFTGGVGGEAGRGFFWRASDTEDTELTGHGLAARLGMPIHDEVVDALDAWLGSLPDINTYQKLDLAFLELRLGCWGFVQSYATPEVLQVQPLIARESFSAMLSLPPEWRRTSRSVTRCIELAWPELLRLPINRYGDLRDYGRPLARAMRNPRLILRKLRKKFG